MPENSNENARLLLVDDEPLILEMIGLFLEDEGFNVTMAGGGAEALEILEQREIDVIITDLSMPEFDGFSLMNAVGILTPDTPVIVLTGMGTLDNAIQAIQHGAYDFVTKPIADMSLLLVPVLRALEKRKILRTHAEYLKRIERQNKALLRDMEAARRIQACMINRDFGEIEDWLRLTTRYLPAELVGGDFYDVFPLGPHHAVFYMADVAGHGVLAAMVTVFAKQAIEPIAEKVAAQTPETGPCPREILEKLNREMMAQCFERGGIPLYLTVFLGIIDRRSGLIRCSNGGHIPLPRLLTREGGLTPLRLKGNPIGLVDQPNLEDRTFFIRPGDSLLLCTDGLLEVLNDRGMAYNTDRLDAFLLKTPNRSGEGLADGVVNLALSRGLDQPDDISVLILALAGPHEAGTQPKASPVVDYRLRPDGFEAELSARLESVDEVDRLTAEFLEARYLDVNQFAVRLLVRESLLNAVRHGGGLDSSKTIRFDIEVKPRNIHIRVEDPGPGFDWRSVMQKEPNLDDVSGRGLTILKSYADEVSYNERGNVITLVLKRGWKPG